MPKKAKFAHELLGLMNVGMATYNDFKLLGINSIKELAEADPDELYMRLQQLTGRDHDPCVWDVFAATIHEARSGERRPWWQWTAIRKQRQAAGTVK